MKYEVVMTAKQAANREKWLEARKAGIGGSEAAAIVGLSKWSSPYQLWLIKTGRVLPEDISGKECVYWGTQLEDMVAKEFCNQTGKKVIRQGLYRSIERPFMQASIDRYVVGENAGLECKTANAYAIKDWEGDKIPPSYYVQCQHYMAVTGYKKWYIACLIGGQHFVWKEIAREEEDIEALINAEEQFWTLVENDTAPSIDGSEITTTYLASKYKGGIKEEIELKANTAERLTVLADIEAQICSLKKQAEEIKNEVKDDMGNNEAGHCPGFMVQWKTTAGRITIDSKALKQEMPDVFTKYAKVGTPSRRFTVKKLEE